MSDTKPAFDAVAQTYDDVFTHSETGKLQRHVVHSLLEKLLKEHPVKSVLELNCGTGADALFFASKGIRVVATDIAPEMVHITRQKAANTGLSHLITTRVLPVNDLSSLEEEEKFDLVFSDFGGLNCIEPADFPTLRDNLKKSLRPDGLFIAVVMPRFCLWESVYFLAKGQFKNAFRRRTSGPVRARLNESTTVDTWYYSPSFFKNAFLPDFKILTCKPVGISLPPSYLEPFFKKRPGLLNWLAKLENGVLQRRFLAGMADHYLVAFRPLPPKGEMPF